MTLDKEIDKVLQRTDAILTKAGYGIVDDGFSTGGIDEYADSDETESAPLPTESSVQFVDSSKVVDDDNEDVRYDSGIPAGLREAPQS